MAASVNLFRLSVKTKNRFMGLVHATDCPGPDCLVDIRSGVKKISIIAGC